MRMLIVSVLALFQMALFAESAPNTELQTENQSESLTKEWQALCDTHQVKKWCFEVLDNTNSLSTNDSITTLPMLDLFEFRKNERFDRKTSPVRKKIENDILLDIENVLEGKDLETPVRLLSIGCTGLLQDWYLVCQLIRQGRTNIELSVVDNTLVKDSCEGFGRFCEAMEAEGVSIRFALYDSLETCVRAQKSPFHAVYAIDYYDLLTYGKNTWRNFSVARKHLTSKGHIFASYLDEIISFDSDGKIHVIETSPENQRLRETIVAAQLSNPRSKDCSIRVQVLISNPLYISAPLLYAVSDLINKGYRDIMIYAGMKWGSEFSSSDISALFTDTTDGKVNLIWKKMQYIQHKTEDRRDLVLVDLRGFDFKDSIDLLNHHIVLLGTLVPENGHWIVSADQLGIWDVNGKGQAKAITIPEEHRKTAKALMSKLFAHGGHWY